MSAPIPVRTGGVASSRTGLLAAASVVVATTSVAVTLAVSTSGGSSEPAPQPAGAENGPSAAERFHHFR